VSDWLVIMYYTHIHTSFLSLSLSLGTVTTIAGFHSQSRMLNTPRLGLTSASFGKWARELGRIWPPKSTHGHVTV